MNAHGRTIRLHRLREFHVSPTHPVRVQHGGTMRFAHLDEGGMIGNQPSQFSKHAVPDVGVKGCESVSDLTERCKFERRTFRMRLEVAVDEDRVLDRRGVRPTFDPKRQTRHVVVFEVGRVLDGTERVKFAITHVPFARV
eukprot:scaffold139_cov325-Pavlova_lutheri.AAC.10